MDYEHNSLVVVKSFMAYSGIRKVQQVLSIALLSIDPTVINELKCSFDPSFCQTQFFDSVEELLTSQEHDTGAFDCCVFGLSEPGQALSRYDDIKLLNEKRDGTLVVCLLWPETEHLLSELYDLGVNLIFLAPHKPELIQGRILAAKQQFLRTHLASSPEDLRMKRESMLCQVIDAQQEALFVINELNQELIRNYKAEKLLQSFNTDEQLRFGKLLRKLCYDYSQQPLASEPSCQRHQVVSFSTTDGLSLTYKASISELAGDDQISSGWIISISDQEDLRFVGYLISQAQRSFALNFLLVAGISDLLENKPGYAGEAPLKLLEDLLEEQQPYCSLQATLFSLIEVLDCIWPTGTQLRINIDQDITIALSSSALTRLLGQLLLHAVIQAGIDGETEIDGEANKGSQHQTLVITAKSALVPKNVFSAPLTDAVKSSLSGQGGNDALHLENTGSLITLQKQLRKSGGRLDWKDCSDHEQQFILMLPTTAQNTGKA